MNKKQIFPEVEEGCLAVTSKADLLESLFGLNKGDLPDEENPSGLPGKTEILRNVYSSASAGRKSDGDSEPELTAEEQDRYEKGEIWARLLKVARLESTIEMETELLAKMNTEDD